MGQIESLSLSVIYLHNQKLSQQFIENNDIVNIYIKSNGQPL